MSSGLVFGFLSASIALTVCPDKGREVDVIGHAYPISIWEQKSSETDPLLPIYCEYHYRDSALEASREQVKYYRYQDANPFAEKTLVYRDRLAQPDIQQIDNRFDEQRKAERSESGWKVMYKPPGSKKVDTERISLDRVEVVDAGFDAAVRDNWQSIYSGETVRFSFLSIPHLRAVRLRVRKREPEACLDGQLTNDVVCLWVEADNAFLRLIFPSLRLTYDASDRRLLAFEGPVNLLNEKQKTEKAVIFYQYQ